MGAGGGGVGGGGGGGRREMGIWISKEEGEQLNELVGLFGEPSVMPARTLGQGIKTR